jgi:hypothetical protein
MMRKAILIASLLVATAAQESIAESWQAYSILDTSRSAGNCQPGSAQPFLIDVVDSKLTLSGSVGKYFTAPVPSDGRISQPYKSPTGAQLELVGNAKTRELEIVNSRFGCRWKLVPRSN